nr:MULTISPECIES: TIGR02530 family flagellar biosynthesis protein [Virgibacillus]
MDHRIHQISKHAMQPLYKTDKRTEGASFKDILASQQQEIKGLTISKHATDRLQERNIQITEKQWRMIENKVAEAKEKGITDSLVVLEQASLLISTKNNTVVTAMDRNDAMNRIFTNINGTILIEE